MKFMENLCRYILYTGCQTKNFQQEYWVLRQQFYLNFHHHGNIRKLYISYISRHFVYNTITFLSMKYMSLKIDLPNFSNLDILHYYFHLFIHNIFLSKLLVRCFFVSQNFGFAKCFVSTCILYIVYCILYIVYCILYIVYCILY